MVKAYEADVYTVKRIKQKLQEHYKEDIFFAELSGRKNVVCFKNMAELIISDKWYSDRKSDKADEASRIIETVAKLIKCSIRDDLNKQNETYPSSEEDLSKVIMLPILNLNPNNETCICCFTIRYRSMQKNEYGRSIGNI